MKTVLIVLVAALSGFLGAIGMLSEHIADDVRPMKDGVYTVYQVYSAYDVKTGKPIYWVTGSKDREAYFSDLKIPLRITSDHVRLWTVDRESFPIRQEGRVEMSQRHLKVVGGQVMIVNN